MLCRLGRTISTRCHAVLRCRELLALAEALQRLDGMLSSALLAREPEQV